MSTRATALGTARLVALGSVLWLAGCGAASPGHAAPSPTRAIGNCTASRATNQAKVDATSAFRFVPATVCLLVGGTVTWTNTTKDLDHTSTDVPAFAASPKDASIPQGGHGWNLRLTSGHSASLTFHRAGVYRYFCIPHETAGMVGVVVVVSGS